MENKIKQVNNIFDRYDPIGVHYGMNNNYTDEYVQVSVRFVHEAAKLGVKHALDDAMIYMFTDVKHCRKYVEIYDNMLKELKHVFV